MSRFTILLAGRIADTPALRAAVAGTRVIAADRGMSHAATLGLEPDLWIGDFDSADTALQARFDDVPRESFSSDKDKTDGELAIEAAIARGAREILLVGAFGGARTDHAFAHLVLALRYAHDGLAVEMFDGRERAFPLLPGRRVFAAAPGTPFSILRFGAVTGLCIAGARYPLDGVGLPFHSILTQSNEATGPIEIALGSGQAILLMQAEPYPA